MHRHTSKTSGGVGHSKGDCEWPTFKCVTDDLPRLLRCASPFLRPFCSVLMKPPAVPALPQFISPASAFPIVVASNKRLLQLSEFAAPERKSTELVEFCISLVSWNLTPGSQQSVELLKALEKCQVKQVLDTAFAGLVIEQKWRYFYSFTLLLTCLYAATLVLMLQAREGGTLDWTFIC